jgi:hypothetical protein
VTAVSYPVLRCDAKVPDAPDGECGSEGYSPGWVANHTELRRLLRKECGWRRPKPGRDICPDCWAAGRR